MALFICSNCEYGSGSWLGRCPNCGEWNTLVERETPNSSRSKNPVEKLTLTPLSKIQSTVASRKKTGVYEFDRVLGGGFVPGEVILLTGEPGIGKSTLLLQALSKLTTVYVSGEEAGHQVKERAQRLKINLNSLLFSDNLQVEGLIAGLDELNDSVDVIVIDSIQTVYSKDSDSPAGSVNQLKEIASKLIPYAKREKVMLIFIGHVTKGGDIAGPKTLEHLVDCVLSFEGEKLSHYRILRSTKNRYGSGDEIGIFEMNEKGLAEVTNPLAFLESVQETTPGKTIVGVAEGKRPLFYEIQTLVVPSNLPMPRRIVKGVDYNKVLLLLAVLRKHISLPLDNFDIYVNVVGGVQIRSTAADLGIIASVISSVKNITIPPKTVFIGEVGLLGEVRKVVLESRIVQEAKRLKFQRILSSLNVKTIKDLNKILSVK
ncbi:DNA repair protein RadA [Candidatus Roizmanbacteria bacterium RIFCSPHIGHO2_12_41_18]|nr:MAG: DNA repair protein RadA [Candidatus Roizmanbacteria bacterium RIFCSPHIGHO2_12_41_18]